jgi:membrane peptidoglycan carboxypeptidase
VSSPKRRAAGKAPTRTSARGSGKAGLGTRLLRGGLVLGVGGLVLGVLAFLVLYKAINVPAANADFQTQTTFVYYDDGKTELGRFAEQNRVSIPLRTMPQNMQDAVVAAENRSFWTDEGLDPKGILRAAFSNAQGNATQGASTITQQYVKILYLTSERSLTRKIKEAIVSLKIHRQQSKAEILEGYLNTIYFGRGAYGIQAAAQAFFDKDAKRLSLRECAVLATVLNNPSAYDPANGKDARRELKDRYGYVLDGMADMGTITAKQADRAAKRLPVFPEIEGESKYGGQRGHMLTLVKKELVRLGFSEQEIDGGGLRVTTTLNQQTMQDTQAAVLEQRPAGFGDKQLHVGAASVEVGTGALKGFYGGQDYLDSQINWAATGGMAGSTFKAFAVAAAIKQGFSLKDGFEGNSPLDIYDITVNNEGPGDGNDYGSSVSLEKATADSINTAFVDMSDRMDEGSKAIYETARDLGIPPEPEKSKRRTTGIPSSTPDLSPSDFLIALGRARVSPINMANAYASIANEGERSDVHVVSKVVDASGETRYSHKQSSDRAISEDIAADTSYALQKVVQEGTGRSTLGLGRPAAGKTGTATNDKDQVSSAWFAGYTPQVATAVMYVRGDGDDQLDGWLPSYFGASYPAATWTAIMQRVMEGKEVESFPAPAFLDGDAPGEDITAYTPPPAPTTTAPPPSSTTQAPAPEPTTKKPEPKPTQEPEPEPEPEDPPPDDGDNPGGGGGDDSCGLLNPCDPDRPGDRPSESPSEQSSNDKAARRDG